MDLKSLTEKISRKKAIDALFIIVVVIIGLLLSWKTVEIIIFAIFIWSILNPIPSKYLAAIVIFFLVLTPIFLVAGKSFIADRTAIYAYYFLIISIIMGIYETRKENLGQETN